jgi:hypothetical protein
MKTTLFWYAAPCCLVEIYRRFRDAYCLHQGDEYPSFLSRFTVILTLDPVRPTPFFQNDETLGRFRKHTHTRWPIKVQCLTYNEQSRDNFQNLSAADTTQFEPSE